MLEKVYKSSTKSLDTLDKVLSKILGKSPPLIYTYGFNIYAERLAKKIILSGVIIDNAQEQEIAGLPIIDAGLIPSDALVICCAAGRPLTVLAKLAVMDVMSIHVFSLMKSPLLDLGEIHFNDDFERHYLDNFDLFLSVYNSLSDAKSKIIMEKIIAFRSTYDVQYLKGFQFKEDVQYFEDFLCLNRCGESFVDVGGYDGYTTQQFIHACEEFLEVNIIEPDEANYRVCLDRFRLYDNVNIHPIGLGSESTQLNFSSAGSSSCVSSHGGSVVNIDTLDSLNLEHVTFIKMDIEGGESSALSGARQTILDHYPRLAIAVYHGADQLWQIHRAVISIRKDYDVYIRHYTESIYETIMFFIPKKK